MPRPVTHNHSRQVPQAGGTLASRSQSEPDRSLQQELSTFKNITNSQRQSSKRFNAEDQELQYSTFKQNLFPPTTLE